MKKPRDKFGKDIRVMDWIILFFSRESRQEVVQIKELGESYIGPYDTLYYKIRVAWPNTGSTENLLIYTLKSFGIDFTKVERLPRQKNKRNSALALKKLSNDNIIIPPDL